MVSPTKPVAFMKWLAISRLARRVTYIIYIFYNKGSYQLSKLTINGGVFSQEEITNNHASEDNENLHECYVKIAYHV